MSTIHESIETVEIPRNYFNRSKPHYLSMEVGKIIPLYTEMLIPNDLVKLKNKIVVRQQPTISPSFSNYVMTTRTFVVAIRNLDKNILRFISGYKEYSTKTKYEEPLKYWKPTKAETVAVGTLWDYMGFPTDCLPDDESLPIDYPRQAYNYIWDLYFRNETIQDSILVDGEPSSSTNEMLLNINWNRDYFTTALPFQQLSDPIGLPITGNASAKFAIEEGEQWGQLKDYTIRTADKTASLLNPAFLKAERSDANLETPLKMTSTNITAPIPRTNVYVAENGKVTTDEQVNRILGNNIVDMTNISSVLISDLRYAFALQLYAEMMARGGIRDNEFLLMMYGTAPTDETLGRPYYLGGSKTNIITSEVLQTSQSTDTATLGELGGHGLGVSESEEITYHAKEFCILMTLGYIKPNTTYAQGMPKTLSQKTKYDFPLPVFSHLSEQPVFNREILCASKGLISETGEISPTTDPTAEVYNKTIWGYRPIYDEYRDAWGQVSGLLKPTFYFQGLGWIPKMNLANWTETRFFDRNDGARPHLNNDFLKCEIDNRNYAITDNSVDRAQFLVAYQQEAHYWRPLSLLGTPGRIDHIL